MPFPFVESDRLQARPALIVSRPVGPNETLLWSLMITSARHSSWPGDIEIGQNHERFGLPVPCFIRTAKIAAPEIASIERKLGSLSSEMLEQVEGRLRSYFDWK